MLAVGGGQRATQRSGTDTSFACLSVPPLHGSPAGHMRTIKSKVGKHCLSLVGGAGGAGAKFDVGVRRIIFSTFFSSSHTSF